MINVELMSINPKFPIMLFTNFDSVWCESNKNIKRYKSNSKFWTAVLVTRIWPLTYFINKYKMIHLYDVNWYYDNNRLIRTHGLMLISTFHMNQFTDDMDSAPIVLKDKDYLTWYSLQHLVESRDRSEDPWTSCPCHRM